MSTKFFTNTEANTLLNKFEGVFSYNPNIQCFDALVGYFRASGYFRIRPFLEKVPHIRILVGINVDKLIADAHRKGFALFNDSNKTKEEFITALKADIATADYDAETEKGILQFIEDIIQNKIAVKAHPNKKIHAKVYIFRPERFNPHTPAQVITGSSNLTDSGLGAGTDFNYEFNVQLNDYDDVCFATDEFKKLWEEAIDILPVDIQRVKNETYLNTEITPFEIYIKVLIEHFGKDIDYDPDTIGDLPPNFKKLAYQIDAVNQGFGMLSKHNGFILADVVGLGKTVIAAMVAKKFLIENGSSRTKILVVYPPAVEKNWKNTFKYFGIDKYTKFITNGSLQKILDNHPDYWHKDEYDLIVVDEAHRFRNRTTGAFEKLQRICKSPRSNQGRVPGSQKKVILVTATPLNNHPEDIFNQILLFQDAGQSTLPVTNLTRFFAQRTEDYRKLKSDPQLNVNKLREIYSKIRKDIIEPITIRRTRRDIEEHPDYQADLQAQGITFPKVNPPQKIEYEMDDKLNELFYRTVYYLTDKNKICYARYRAIAALIPEKAADYERPDLIAESLASIMKTQLIKRLESSFYAFKKSLINFLKATDRMIEMFNNDKIFIVPDININHLLDKGYSYEEIEQQIERLSEQNPRNRVFKAADFRPHFKDELIKDAELLTELLSDWNKIPADPKLNVFLLQIQHRLFKPDINVEGKLVIFSESKETVHYLKEVLAEKGRTDVLAISSDNRNYLHETIVANFDANCPPDKQENNYNIIITTEVLAEGVNLHRANVILHYDTPWNATRLMQRIGRVNRIGTKATTIHNYVFYPSVQGDEQINLSKTAYMKIQAFHTAFGEDNQVYSKDEILDDVKLFNEEAIREEQDEHLKYLHFLRTFKNENTEWFNKIKKIPLKSRTGRNAQTANQPERKGGTAVFLKTNKKFEFYWVADTQVPEEITPVEAFKIFEAEMTESGVPLIEHHHKHVTAAITHFEALQEKQAAEYANPEALGGVAKTAKKYLSDLIRCTQSAAQKEKIQRLINLINIGKYNNLPAEVNKIQKKQHNLVKTLEAIDEIAAKYDYDAHTIYDSSQTQENHTHTDKTVLILSESFA